jgi:hypothetical protein
MITLCCTTCCLMCVSVICGLPESCSYMFDSQKVLKSFHCLVWYFENILPPSLPYLVTTFPCLMNLNPAWFENSVCRFSSLDWKKTKTQPNPTKGNWTIGCFVWDSVWLPVACLTKYPRTDQRPVATECNWSFNCVYCVQYIQLKLVR